MSSMIMLCSKTYATSKNKKVLLESSYTTKVVGIGDMKLQFISEKKNYSVRCDACSKNKKESEFQISTK